MEGEGENYVVYRNLSKSKCVSLGLKTTLDKKSWRYDFGDGWTAEVTAVLWPSTLKKEKSDGFCGYEWMVDNIIKWNCPRYDCEKGGYRPRHIFLFTEKFNNRKKGDSFKCLRCGKVLEIGKGDFDWIAVEGVEE